MLVLHKWILAKRVNLRAGVCQSAEPCNELQLAPPNAPFVQLHMQRFCNIRRERSLICLLSHLSVRPPPNRAETREKGTKKSRETNGPPSIRLLTIPTRFVPSCDPVKP